MHVAGAKRGAEFGEDRLEIRTRSATPTGTGRWCPSALMFADAEIRPDQDMNRRMLGPICHELFEIEERHLVDYGVAVAAGGGEEAINMSPAVPTSWTGSDASPAIVEPAPGLAPRAAASPRRLSRSFNPEPVRTAFSTALALPRSSRFSTMSVVASG